MKSVAPTDESSSMPIVYPDILQRNAVDQSFAWDPQKTILYALSLGFGAEPLNEPELRFVYEADLRAVPSMATVLAWGCAPSLSSLGIDTQRTVHVSQSAQLHQPLASSGEVFADSRVASVHDKGAKGALIEIETLLRDRDRRNKIATLVTTVLARADGDFGGPSGETRIVRDCAQRAPDMSVDFETRSNQALLYRLLGDRNPLHVDPAVARRAGFPQPILHGLCTFGIACRALLQHCADYRAETLRSLSARFSAAVVPGETLTFDLWKDGDTVSFQARVGARGVLSDGRAVFGAV